MFAAYPGLDPASPAGFPELSPRRFKVLLERLPPHARRGGEQWSTEAELLALVVDHLAQLTYVQLKRGGAKSVKKPRPLERPKARADQGRQKELQRKHAAWRQRKESGHKPASWGEAAALLTGREGFRVSDG